MHDNRTTSQPGKGRHQPYDLTMCPLELLLFWTALYVAEHTVKSLKKLNHIHAHTMYNIPAATQSLISMHPSSWLTMKFAWRTRVFWHRKYILLICCATKHWNMTQHATSEWSVVATCQSFEMLKSFISFWLALNCRYSNPSGKKGGRGRPSQCSPPSHEFQRNGKSSLLRNWLFPVMGHSWFQSMSHHTSKGHPIYPKTTSFLTIPTLVNQSAVFNIILLTFSPCAGSSTTSSSHLLVELCHTALYMKAWL